MSKRKGRQVPQPQAGTIYVDSLYGYKADMPLVELELVDFPEPRVQMTVAQAREIAVQLLEACEAAQSDAHIVRFFRDTVEMELDQIGELLQVFRAERQRMNEPGNTEKGMSA